MNNEVSTAVRFEIPSVWIVLNDGRYNMCAQGMALQGLSGNIPIDTEIPSTNFAAIARTVRDFTGEKEALNTLGNISYQKDEYDKAIDYYQQVLAIDRSQKNRRGEGLAQGNIGLAYASKGEAAKAINYLEKDLAIEQEFHERLEEGHCKMRKANT